MKKARNFIFTILMMTFSGIIAIAQSYHDGHTFSHSLKTHSFPERWQMDMGFYNTIPTSTILFPSWRDNVAGLHRQTLSTEWNVPHRPGGYLELSYNIGQQRPIYLGFGTRFQSLNYLSETHYTSPPEIDGESYMNVQWTYTNSSRLTDYRLFGEYSIWYTDRFSLFGRGDIGLANYRHRSSISWKRVDWDSENAKRVPLRRDSAVSLALDLGLGFRWQFNELFALRGHVGYQIQTANNFLRSNYYNQLDASLDLNTPLPKKGDFKLIEPTEPMRPIRFQHEHLNAQIGISMSLDGKFLAEKPILYLYPEDTTDVNVEIALHDQEFIFTYPKYSSKGWTVQAHPDGRLYDYKTNREYYSLFWETEGAPIASNLQNGFVVSGNDSASFLERKLDMLGLNYKEANEFIIYWLPQMEQNPYNAVYFAFEEYEASSELTITPAPDTIIRIMMLWEPLESPISLTAQELPETPVREGFVAVEWGGTKGQFFSHNTDVVNANGESCFEC